MIACSCASWMLAVSIFEQCCVTCGSSFSALARCRLVVCLVMCSSPLGWLHEMLPQRQKGWGGTHLLCSCLHWHSIEFGTIRDSLQVRSVVLRVTVQNEIEHEVSSRQLAFPSRPVSGHFVGHALIVFCMAALPSELKVVMVGDMDLVPHRDHVQLDYCDWAGNYVCYHALTGERLVLDGAYSLEFDDEGCST
eukprot:6472520-Amphidinium_carterae.3